MVEAQDKLAEFWRTTATPARDAVFVAETLLRVSQRAAMWRAAAIAVWSIVAGVALSSFAPLLQSGLSDLGAPLAAALGAASLGVLIGVFARRTQY